MASASSPCEKRISPLRFAETTRPLAAVSRKSAGSNRAFPFPDFFLGIFSSLILYPRSLRFQYNRDEHVYKIAHGAEKDASPFRLAPFILDLSRNEPGSQPFSQCKLLHL